MIITRINENAHQVSDVIGGLLLAMTFVPPFFARAVCQHTMWQEFLTAASPAVGEGLGGEEARLVQQGRKDAAPQVSEPWCGEHQILVSPEAAV